MSALSNWFDHLPLFWQVTIAMWLSFWMGFGTHWLVGKTQ